MKIRSVVTLAPALLASSLLLATSVQAKPRSGGAKTVSVSAKKMADKVEIHIDSSTPLSGASWKWIGQPKRLRLSLPGASLEGKPEKMALDKGVVQWLETTSDGNGVFVDLAAGSAPKNSANIDAGRQHIVWTVLCTEMSSNEQVPSLSPGGEVASAAKGESNPKVVRPKQPKVGSQPKVAAQPKVQSEPAARPTKSEKDPVSVNPASNSATTTLANPVQSTTAAGKVITFTANGDLRPVLESLAAQAGLKAEIDSNVSGNVYQGFREVPLNKIVSTILGQQSTLYDYSITDTTLKVTAPAGAGKTIQLSPTAATPAGSGTSEYFPIRDKVAAEILDAVRKQVPSLTYTLDERLNQILVEGDAQEIERLRKLLQAVTNK